MKITSEPLGYAMIAAGMSRVVRGSDVKPACSAIFSLTTSMKWVSRGQRHHHGRSGKILDAAAAQSSAAL
ncbi:MAG: hypothetical protein R2860_15550 [Desulfobacterales bacterium]